MAARRSAGKAAARSLERPAQLNYTGRHDRRDDFAIRGRMIHKDRVQALEETLHRLGLVVDGVKTCVVVNHDGFAIAAYPSKPQDNTPDGHLSAARVAAVAATLAGLAERTLDQLAQGDMGRLLLEGESGTLLSCPAGQVTLALVIEPGASMGHVLFAAQKAAAEVESILAIEPSMNRDR